MKVTMKLEPGKIRTSYGLGTSTRARRQLAALVRRHCDKYVPYDTGQLKSTAVIAPDGRTITYPQHYAQAQYRRGYRHSDPNRGPYWERRMLLNEKTQLLREFSQQLKEGRH